MQPLLKVVVLNFTELYKLFHSVASSVALEQSASLVWREEKGSFIKTMAADIYNIEIGFLVGKKSNVWEPPMADIHLADKLQTQEKAAKLTAQYWKDFLSVAKTNPKQLKSFLVQLESKKNASKQRLTMLFQEADQINQGIEKEIGKRLMNTAVVKFTANTSLIIMSSYLPGGQAVALGLVLGGTTLHVQFYQNADAIGKANTILVGMGDAQATTFQTTLNNTSKHFAAELKQLLFSADRVTTQQLSHAMKLSAHASLGASIAGIAGQSVQFYAIGLEAKDLYSTYKATR